VDGGPSEYVGPPSRVAAKIRCRTVDYRTIVPSGRSMTLVALGTRDTVYADRFT
jgi:hypothetical protein